LTQRSEKSTDPTDRPFVFVVDDDASVRAGLARLFRSVQLSVEVFASAQEFLATSAEMFQAALCSMSACRD
jgi:FixJ family two-component response regulator